MRKASLFADAKRGAVVLSKTTRTMDHVRAVEKAQAAALDAYIALTVVSNFVGPTHDIQRSKRFLYAYMGDLQLAAIQL
jgi:hypothetical protein